MTEKTNWHIYFLLVFFLIIIFALFSDYEERIGKLETEIQELKIECEQASERAKFAEQTTYNIINGVY